MSSTLPTDYWARVVYLVTHYSASFLRGAGSTLLIALVGTFVGCLIGNILGGAILPDIVFGSIATLIGAFFTWKLREQKPVVATLPPIISNIIIVPFVLRYGYGVTLPIPFMMLTVGIGEVISCTVLGLIVYGALKKYKGTLFHTA